MSNTTRIEGSTHEPNDKPKQKKMSGFFNKVAKALPGLAIGAGTMITVKAGTVALLATAPIWATLVATATTVAAASMALEHVKAVHAERKNAQGSWKSYFSFSAAKENICNKKTGCKALFNAAATLVGGAAVLAFDHFDVGDKIVDVLGIGETQSVVTDITPVGTVETTHGLDTVETTPEPEVTQEVVVPEPTPEPEAIEKVGVVEPISEPEVIEEIAIAEPSPLDDVSTLFDDVDTETILSQTLLASALNGDMQAVKDLAYFLFNGFQGLPQTPDLAAELYTIASEASNIQAQTDYAYIQYHGLVPEVITQDKEEALKTINELGRSWVGGASLLDSNAPLAKVTTAPRLKL